MADQAARAIAWTELIADQCDRAGKPDSCNQQASQYLFRWRVSSPQRLRQASIFWMRRILP